MLSGPLGVWQHSDQVLCGRLHFRYSRREGGGGGMISLLVAGKAIHDENRQIDIALGEHKTHCLHCNKSFSLLRRKSVCTSCHEAFCKECTGLYKFDKVDIAQRLCELCSKAGHCLSLRSSSEHEALPTRFSEEDLIVPVLEEHIPVANFPIAQTGPAAHFYRTYYQGTDHPPPPPGAADSP
ncbi:Aste57867_3987 [Aphanomyces stellatus]|uniref:Aste57867_3987 protein n=1 Tax=Aphanomyces stellatus TaxID=120398 RepID=A0A485KG35_9STRA|nr:hypothetical protein As57867_003976 [Aphanomyces stellatus]VFT81124.1 Aste57867_3987 [Aphanomyces stellatus]